MTSDEFEQGYADRSGVTVEWLHEKGQRAVPCDCGDAKCKGWQMASLDSETQKKQFNPPDTPSKSSESRHTMDDHDQEYGEFVKGPFGCEVDKKSLTPAFVDVEGWSEKIHDAIAWDMEGDG